MVTMTDDDITPEEPQEPEDHGGEEPVSYGTEVRIPIDPSIFQSLIPFQDLQRTIAAIDFSGLRSAQEAAAAFASSIPDLPRIQLGVQHLVGNSIDFNALSDLQKKIATTAIPDQTLLQSLAKSLNIDALTRVNALLSAADFPAFAEAQSAIAVVLTAHTQDWLTSFESIDVQKLLEGLDRWLPDNLRGVDDLSGVADIALNEGIPLCWVPRTEIVVRLAEADSADDRMELIDEYQDEIIDDCSEALANVPHQWARECEDAIAGLRARLSGPAQSHAACIIDSIVLCTLGTKGREAAKTRAKEDWEDLALRVAGENLALRPLYRALVTWFPNSGMPLPDHFARHPTAHAVGQSGLFKARYALIGVMLAVSLTVQFWTEPAAADGLLPEDPEGGLDPS
jgi:hypothetical protein